MNLNAQQIDALKDCKSAEEIIAKAAQAGIELDENAAQQILDDYCFQEIDPEGLEAVSGGCSTYSYYCAICDDHYEQDDEPHKVFVLNTGYCSVCESCYQAHKDDPNYTFSR